MTESAPGNSFPEAFRLKPVKAARVSEISEAVASSAVPAIQRVNFHIGNPAKDKVLTDCYSSIIFQGHEELMSPHHSELIRQVVDQCVSYCPRGGYDRKKPHDTAIQIHKILTETDTEPLDYDLGQEGKKRELIFQSGGLTESFRVFFTSLSRYLFHSPAAIYTWQLTLPDFTTEIKGLNILSLESSENTWLESLEKRIEKHADFPVFLILGNILSEKERRFLRGLSLKAELFIVEASNAPNSLSIAREAGMKHTVIRFLTGEFFHPDLKNLSTVTIAGNSHFLEVMENVHFELKGTPSTSEILLLGHLIRQHIMETPPDESPDISAIENNPAVKKLPAEETSDDVQQIVNKITDLASYKTDSAFKRLNSIQERFTDILSGLTEENDPFLSMDPNELTRLFFKHFSDKDFQSQLTKAFTSAFCRTHTEYTPSLCTAVSGSSRTALSLLGFHCGIREVIAPDLGWTYSHCFPEVTTIPLKENLDLDTDAIVRTVAKKTEQDPHWKHYGAVVLNTPHNASGKVYSRQTCATLLKALLQQNIMVIDDLSYENIHPRKDLNGEGTLKQIVNELVAKGQLRKQCSRYLITVHSLSKTDCFAGARMAVAEIAIDLLNNRFRTIISQIEPNIMAIFISYLFYRNGKKTVDEFWLKRNMVFQQRMNAIQQAFDEFPEKRNLFGLHIVPPEGSMYPRLVIPHLPGGLSLEWLSSGLAARGIGLVPLSTFSKTEKGYELGRKTFRLSLGGNDPHTVLKTKMRKTLIDLNRLIESEAALYTHYTVPVKTHSGSALEISFEYLVEQISESGHTFLRKGLSRIHITHMSPENLLKLWNDHLNTRIKAFIKKTENRKFIQDESVRMAVSGSSVKFTEMLEKELFKHSLPEREFQFRNRLYDRTVHPTQVYSLKTDMAFEELGQALIDGSSSIMPLIETVGRELSEEFLCSTVPISSADEAQEVILDLNALIDAELWGMLNGNQEIPALLSFWGDWDGSTRPSGQGHRLAASVLMENILLLTRLVDTLHRNDTRASFSREILKDISDFRKNSRHFSGLLNSITDLTHQLEKRYQGLLPSQINPGLLKRLGLALNLSTDPVTAVLEHNDTLENRMESLRLKRSDSIESFFSLYKRLRKALTSHLHLLPGHRKNSGVIKEFILYRDLLKRFALTPRIHQKIIEDPDSFSIDRTVQNISEINSISGQFGCPGIIMALQISMSTSPEALIDLDRKFRAERSNKTKDTTPGLLPHVRLVPLFEEKESVHNLEKYLNRLWSYCETVSDMNQTTASRFSEIISELFVAGSDLSQQLGQTEGAALYRQAKYTALKWLAERGLAEQVRIKLGSGEPMQRQGGYYSPQSGQPTLYDHTSKESAYWLNQSLTHSAAKSIEYARSPLQGIMSGGEFRTLQSNISETLRQLPAATLADILHHMNISQTKNMQALGRAVQPLVNTRLNIRTREMEELKRMTLGQTHPLFEEFIELSSRYFRQILYGSDTDLAGIHTVSYFISRTTPAFRDRPVVRPSRHSGAQSSRKVLEQLKSMVPQSGHGSMLRAIGHNRAQTSVLGVNQLTTGVFRALSEILSRFQNIEEGKLAIADRILPFIPVKDMLHTLRIMHNPELSEIIKFEDLFPSASSAFHIMKEDNRSIPVFIPMFQKEVIRREGLKGDDFFIGDRMRHETLPLFRPDLAVLLQNNLFNTDFETMTDHLNGPFNPRWKQEMTRVLSIPEKVKTLRQNIWSLIEQPIRKQVDSFLKVAAAVHTMTRSSGSLSGLKHMASPILKGMSSDLLKNLAGEQDPALRQFLQSAVEYFSDIAGGQSEIPVETIRVLRDVEQILTIEKQALNKKNQELFRFYLIEMGRVSGENG